MGMAFKFQFFAYYKLLLRVQSKIKHNKIASLHARASIGKAVKEPALYTKTLRANKGTIKVLNLILLAKQRKLKLADLQQ